MDSTSSLREDVATGIGVACTRAFRGEVTGVRTGTCVRGGRLARAGEGGKGEAAASTLGARAGTGECGGVPAGECRAEVGREACSGGESGTRSEGPRARAVEGFAAASCGECGRRTRPADTPDTLDVLASLAAAGASTVIVVPAAVAAALVRTGDKGTQMTGAAAEVELARRFFVGDRSYFG